jgi:hypothetical protein
VEEHLLPPAWKNNVEIDLRGAGWINLIIYYYGYEATRSIKLANSCLARRIIPIIGLCKGQVWLNHRPVQRTEVWLNHRSVQRTEVWLNHRPVLRTEVRIHHRQGQRSGYVVGLY